MVPPPTPPQSAGGQVMDERNNEASEPRRFQHFLLTVLLHSRWTRKTFDPLIFSKTLPGSRLLGFKPFPDGKPSEESEFQCVKL